MERAGALQGESSQTDQEELWCYVLKLNMDAADAKASVGRQTCCCNLGRGENTKGVYHYAKELWDRLVQ